ncbi:MAG: NAD+ synthase [Candidatus Omnitrophota bacterium]|nr:NAD+ synthase [Candidatus Omnitrophota bacterium]
MRLRVAMAQINVTVGALAANREKICGAMDQARKRGAGLVLFPELAVTGYPPEDLLLKPSFIRETQAALRRIVPLSKGICAVVGFADQDRSGRLTNAAAVLRDGRLIHTYHKMMLPNYGVFDEKRYFTAGKKPLLFDCGGVRVGLSICEDIWRDDGPCRTEAASGARLLVNLSASPYHAGKWMLRERILTRRARQCRSWICYTNLVGGQDELVFDGGSMVVDPRGRTVFKAPQFKEGLFIVELPADGSAGGCRSLSGPSARPMKPEEEVFHALVLGLRDYVSKNGFSRVVVGMSGGVDSALTAVLAVAALGRGSVTAVSMPSRYSSAGTQRDARKAAKALGIRFLEIPIEPVFQTFLSTLERGIGRTKPDATEENLQARIRGTLLMALSNKFGWLVLSTGNKSEISTGYCTLYGDMVGGFAVIKDVPKTQVYRISRYANRVFGKKVIPDSVLRRPPSAELKPNQTDQDVLPPYAKLDAVIRAYVEERRPASEIRRGRGSSGVSVGRVLRMIDSSEYKRRQAAPGIKITPLAFGRDRRMPITNQYREG